jgi:DNA modification methylase
MIDIRLGDCRDLLKTIPDGSVDAVITDPPYPEISRDYGRMTEAEWHDLMRRVVNECRRILKPTGSAVFILQPNSERVGRMRPWLWEFMAWTAREWNQVQDAWWWNTAAIPLTKNDPNRLRASLKACVWLGEPDCHRNAASVRWRESDSNLAARLVGRCNNYREQSSRVNIEKIRITAAASQNGGVTPFNVLPIANTNRINSAGSHRHGAGTPQELCDWWIRYICPPGGTILDPFMGSGTTGLSALKYGCSYIGFEQMPRYFDISKARLDAAMAAFPLFAADR